jgi:hypothetical protein
MISIAQKRHILLATGRSGGKMRYRIMVEVPVFKLLS